MWWVIDVIENGWIWQTIICVQNSNLIAKKMLLLFSFLFVTPSITILTTISQFIINELIQSWKIFEQIIVCYSWGLFQIKNVLSKILCHDQNCTVCWIKKKGRLFPLGGIPLQISVVTFFGKIKSNLPGDNVCAPWKERPPNNCFQNWAFPCTLATDSDNSRKMNRLPGTINIL